MADSAEPLIRTKTAAPRVTVLDRFAVADAAGGEMTPKSRKARALAAYVILTGAPVGRERLKGLLWGDRGDEQAAASLRQALYELRDLAAGPTPALVVSRDQVAPGEGVQTDIAELIASADAGEVAGR